jgi:MFS family permease
MDTSDAVFEADAGLDSALARERHKKQTKQQGKRTAKVANGAVSSAAVGEENVDENAPLLGLRDEQGGDRRPSWSGPSAEFENLPWYQRPSMGWMLGPFFVLAIAFGGVIAPKLNLIIDLVCREYIADKMVSEPGFTMLPVDFNGGSNHQCQIPEVSSRASLFTGLATIIAGILSAIASPKLGALSDRYGRKPLIAVTNVGMIAGEVIFIFAAEFPETFPLPALLFSYALDGACGSFILAMALSHAYATDCTAPGTRNVAFGYFHASLFTGIAIGPILAGYIVKLTGKIVIVFYALTAVHVAFLLFLTLVIPESLSKSRQKKARELHADSVAQRGPNGDWINQLRSLNILAPLKTLYPTGAGTSPSLRWNLILLCAVDTIIFGVGMSSMTVVVIYVRQQFGWETFESGRFMTIANSARVLMLLVLLPAVTRLVRGKPNPSHKKNTGCDTFDLTVMRVAVLFDALGFLGFTLARTGGLFTLSGVIAAAGGVGPPTLQAALTKHVPEERTGQLLGATSLLHCLARVVAPAVFNAIFSATAKSFPQAVFVCLGATFGLAFIASWLIKTGGTFSSRFGHVADHVKLTVLQYTTTPRKQTNQIPGNGIGDDSGWLSRLIADRVLIVT